MKVFYYAAGGCAFLAGIFSEHSKKAMWVCLVFFILCILLAFFTANIGKQNKSALTNSSFITPWNEFDRIYAFLNKNLMPLVFPTTESYKIRVHFLILTSVLVCVKINPEKTVRFRKEFIQMFNSDFITSVDALKLIDFALKHGATTERAYLRCIRDPYDFSSCIALFCLAGYGDLKTESKDYFITKQQIESITNIIAEILFDLDCNVKYDYSYKISIKENAEKYLNDYYE